MDPTFSDANWISMNPSLPGANDRVFAAVVDSSGNLYIGGDFTIAGNVVANGIAKWNGSSWSALGSGMNGRVGALAVSGKDVYAGGIFTTGGGIAATNIAKWNGSSWSALGLGMGGGDYSWVNALAVSGTDVYVAFTTAGAITSHIAKWNGSSWSALGLGMDYVVNALAVSGSDLYAGGGFRMATNAGGVAVTANRIAKWDGSSWSALGSGMDYLVNALAVSGGNLYAGGEFTTAGGVVAEGIARWDGSNWSALGLGLGGGSWGGPRVEGLAVSGSNVYVGGLFTTAGDVAANHIAKWDGSSWSALGSGISSSILVLPQVSALAVSGSNVYAAGNFSTAGGVAADHIATWNGSSWSAMGAGMGISGAFGSPVTALALSGSDLYVGGQFTTAGGVAANNIAQWNGSSWSPLGSGINGSVRALAVSGSELYAGGYFTTAGGVAANHIAKWDGSGWSALGSGISAPSNSPYNGGEVRALAVSGSNLYAGGGFTMGGGNSAANIAKWNGSGWSALGSGMGGGDSPWVEALAVSGSDLYAGGYFTTAGGVAANHIAEWDGSGWSALGSGISAPSNSPYNGGAVLVLAVSGSNVYVGGYFTMAGGVPANHISKWDGSSWSTLVSGMGIGAFVSALAVSGNDLYLGGLFTTAGSITANHIAKWNGSNWSALGSGISGGEAVRALAVSGSDLFVGGDFMTAGGKLSPYIARAYLLPLPALSVRRTGPEVLLSWPSADTADFALEQAGRLAAPANWVTNSAHVTDNGTNKSVTLPATNPAQFFRLRRP